jgi:hypothetical protein
MRYLKFLSSANNVEKSVDLETSSIRKWTAVACCPQNTFGGPHSRRIDWSGTRSPFSYTRFGFSYGTASFDEFMMLYERGIEVN